MSVPMSQIVFFGARSIVKIKEILEKHAPKTIFLVHGKKSYASCGAESALAAFLQKYNMISFSDFDVNPKIEDIKKGIELFRKNKCEDRKSTRLNSSH